MLANLGPKCRHLAQPGPVLTQARKFGSTSPADIGPMWAKPGQTGRDLAGTWPTSGQLCLSRPCSAIIQTRWKQEARHFLSRSGQLQNPTVGTLLRIRLAANLRKMSRSRAPLHTTRLRWQTASRTTRLKMVSGGTFRMCLGPCKAHSFERVAPNAPPHPEMCDRRRGWKEGEAVEGRLWASLPMLSRQFKSPTCSRQSSRPKRCRRRIRPEMSTHRLHDRNGLAGGPDLLWTTNAGRL